MLHKVPLVARMAADPFAGPLPPLVAPTSSLEHAVAHKSLGVGVASGGFLVFYYMGIFKVLQQLGLIREGEVRTAGVSIGSLAMGVAFPGMGSHDEFVQRGIVFAERCRSNRLCFGTLDKEYFAYMDDFLTPNVSEAITGRSCMVFSRGNTSHPVGEFVCDYEDREAVKQAMRVSSYVPGWSSPAPSIEYKGAPGFDGIFSQLMPCPEGVSHCLKMSALPPFDPRRALEGLLDPRELWATAKELVFAVRTFLGDNPRQALREASEARTLATLDVRAWGRVLATNQAPLPDIYPGRYRRSGLSPTQWFMHMLVPPSAEMVQTLYKEGQADGLAFAKAVGWEGAEALQL
ncbi:hypothetical protein Rsub_11457 [Raphidocelis subcapitata]|uniref:PNPLA domain-containing protein n=1 Tax=Raphidocelis subcapitata TaxID=307507 RepID=A0A2V0PLE1_9CHLO|nr:hypothetical protein Rsub_11457 [Raphidocelis subcapitata]|eukprot:GBF98853.1 hypothetical protein Rsub_11457 [Raphidocelis subcapitata]